MILYPLYRDGVSIKFSKIRFPHTCNDKAWKSFSKYYACTTCILIKFYDHNKNCTIHYPINFIDS